jgi:hypothetical protein
MNTSYTTDEPSAALWLEQSTYAGNTLASIIYGEFKPLPSWP